MKSFIVVVLMKLMTLLQISIIVFAVNFKHLKINDWYVYPDWAYALGWMMTTSSVIMVPLWAVIQMCWTTGTFREVCVQYDHILNKLNHLVLLFMELIVTCLFQRLSVLCRPTDPVRLKRMKEDEGGNIELTPAQMTL